jgi:O-antigen ligase
MINNITTYIKNEDKYTLFIYFFLFVLPWNFFKWQMSAFAIILLIWWVIKYKILILAKLKTISEFKPLWLLIIYILYTYISVLWSDSFHNALEHVNQFSKYYFILIPVLFTSLKTEEAINGIKIIIISFSLYAIFSLCIYLGLFTIDDTGSNSNNPKGIMAYAIVSVYMAIGAISSFLIYKTFNIKNNLKIVFLISSILCFIALFINNSRTAQVACILSIITLSLFYYKSSIFKPKVFFGMSVTIVLSLSISYYILQTNGKLDRYLKAYNETKYALTEDNYKGSFGSRLYFNKVGLEILQDNLLFGTGPEDNITKLNEYMIRDKEKYNFNMIYNSFHSQHMDILTRYGLVGYILIITSTVYLIISLRKIKNIYWLAMSFFITTFYASLANVMLIKKPFNYIYICLFVLFSIVAYNSNKEECNA